MPLTLKPPTKIKPKPRRGPLVRSLRNLRAMRLRSLRQDLVDARIDKSLAQKRGPVFVMGEYLELNPGGRIARSTKLLTRERKGIRAKQKSQNRFGKYKPKLS